MAAHEGPMADDFIGGQSGVRGRRWTLFCVRPGAQGHAGNEMADVLAKEATAFKIQCSEDFARKEKVKRL